MDKDELIKELKDSISRVNSTLQYYEDYYISASRTGDIQQKEHCKSFTEYIEIRFNCACLDMNIPELKEALELTKGHLFLCKELVNPDVYSRRFDTALISLIKDEDIDAEVDKILYQECNGGDITMFKRTYPEIVEGIRNNIVLGKTKAEEVLGYLSKINYRFRFNSVKRKIKLTDEFNKVLK